MKMKQERLSESSQPERLNEANDKFIVRHRLDPSASFTAEQRAEIASLKQLSDRDIDFSDIPETAEADWSDAVRGPLLPLEERTLTLKLDEEAYAWLLTKAREDAYGVNFILRREAQRERTKKAAKSAGSLDMAS